MSYCSRKVDDIANFDGEVQLFGKGLVGECELLTAR
jgi:hypothetical protein